MRFRARFATAPTSSRPETKGRATAFMGALIPTVDTALRAVSPAERRAAGRFTSLNIPRISAPPRGTAPLFHVERNRKRSIAPFSWNDRSHAPQTRFVRNQRRSENIRALKTSAIKSRMGRRA